jgi:hypothetical protein
VDLLVSVFLFAPSIFFTDWWWMHEAWSALGSLFTAAGRVFRLI